MTAKIITLDCLSRHDLSADRVLQGAIDADLEGVVLMGYDKEGEHYINAACNILAAGLAASALGESGNPTQAYA